MTRTLKKDPPFYILVVDSTPPPAWRGFPSWTADEYLEGRRDALRKNAVVLNLCKSYQYLSKGYYASLLADARGQRVFPTLEMIEEISNPFTYFRALREAGLDTIDFKVVRGRRLIPKVIVPDPAKAEVLESVTEQGDNGSGDATTVRFREVDHAYEEITAVFGQTEDRRFRRQAKAVFGVYSFPILRIRMYREPDGWKVGQIFPGALNHLSAEASVIFARQISKGAFVEAAYSSPRPKPQRIACLWDNTDEFRPSDVETLEKLERVALKQGAMFEVITKDDLARLPEYDALFIRCVTALEHYSFVFAQRAYSLGMPVIDDPQSIMKCSNKVYLHELFAREDIPTPRTLIVSRRTSKQELAEIGFPLIIKLPQGTFSAGVKKADSAEEYARITAEMFKESPLLIVQEFTPTAFDWRIGLLDGKILFACKYHQAKDHWQIAQRFKSGFTRFGKVEAVALDDVPAGVKRVALKGAALIGDGLYGADIKETKDGPRMIEINDNPNLDLGYEDAVEKDRVYEQIIATFLRRIRIASETSKAQ